MKNRTPRTTWPTRLLLTAVCATPLSAEAQQDISFGTYELFDFGTFAPETRYGWSSGDALVAPLDFNARIGGITGKKNQQITPAVTAWGVTIIPEIRADTRTGARLTSSLQGEAGVQLNAGLTVGGDGFAATLQAGPSVQTPSPLLAGQAFKLRGTTEVGVSSTFDPGLPKLDAGMDVILNGSFNNKFEYGLFPLAGYQVGEFGFDFDLDFSLFDLNLDLNLPKLPSINLPDFPDFSIPASEEDNTLFRQKIPPSNPALNLAELALDNPFATIDTNAGITDDGRATFNAKGSIFRAGLDLDGIATAVTTGVSFTGTEVKIGPGKIGYDVIDVKYGLELGVEYDSQIDPFLNATLTFDKAIVKKNANGTTEVIAADTPLNVRWDDMPEFELLTREDVNVDVDFTDIEAIMTHSGHLTLSDYMELQAIKAKVSVAPGVNLVKIGPAYYQKFPLAGELAAFEVFSNEFSLGSIALPDGLWDDSFTIEAKPIKEVYLNSATADIDVLSELTELSTGTSPTTLPDKTLVIGTPSGPVAGLPDLSPVDYTDTINEVSVTVEGLYREGGFLIRQYSQTSNAPDVTQTTTLDGLVVLEGSSYTLEAGAIRQFDLNFVDNDGQVTGEGALSFESSNGNLTFSGEGEVAFNSPGRIDATTVTNAEGHTIAFNGFLAGDRVLPLPRLDNYTWISGPTTNPITFFPYRFGNTAFRFNHEIVADTFNNFGTLAFSGNNSGWDYSFNRFDNFETGRVELSAGADLTLSETGTSSGVLYNAGTFFATGTNTNLFIEHTVVRTQDFRSGLGNFIADNNARITFNGDFLALINQNFEAKNGGEIIFDVTSSFVDSIQTFGNVEFLIQEGGTVRFNSGLTNKEQDGLNIVNHGTLVVDGNVVSLRPKPDTTSGGGEPPTLVFKDLINTGTIEVINGGEFEVDAIIDNFANDGATLAGGTWNAIGDNTSAFSNLSSGSNTVSEIDFRVLDVAPSDEFLFEVYTDLSTFDTALKTNDANVTISGRAIFPYFNTVEKNTGSFTLSGGHQFTTVAGYTNEGGTTVVQKGADLFIQGALKVVGGSVTVDAASTLTVQTQIEAIDEAETEFRDISVEVIGGDLTLANTDALPSSPMFTDRADSGLFPEFNNMLLNTGQVWIVRELVEIDPVTEQETVTAATIDLGNASIERSNGTIIIDGASARFDAAERMRYNHGSLTLQNGFEFDTLINDFRNAAEGEMTLQGATFRVTGADGQFRNDGNLVMDGDSYLFANQFINGAGATVQLDGVIDSELVTISAGSTITGSGQITGAINNNGTLDLGNSPGLIRSFGSYTQGAGATAVFEFEGYEAGTSFDQLIIQKVDDAGGSSSQPALIVRLDGALDLVFADGLTPIRDFEWMLIDNQGDFPLIGRFNGLLSSTTGLVQDDPNETGGVDTTGDFYLGDLGNAALFLTYQGGDGNDLVVYTLFNSVLGDMNGDDALTNADISAFVMALTDPDGYAATYPTLDTAERGDFTSDGQFTNADISGFVDALVAGDIAISRENLYAALSAQASVPEPSTLALLALGGLLATRRRR